MLISPVPVILTPTLRSGYPNRRYGTVLQTLYP